MGYDLRALIGQRAALESLRKTFPFLTLVELKQQFFLIPLTEQVHNYFENDRRIPFSSGHPFHFLPRMIVEEVQKIASPKLLAYLEADYFGGFGHQASVLWQDGRAIIGPMMAASNLPLLEMPINRVLRVMGVQAEHAIDEFDALGLGSRRDTNNWLK